MQIYLLCTIASFTVTPSLTVKLENKLQLDSSLADYLILNTECSDSFNKFY